MLLVREKVQEGVTTTATSTLEGASGDHQSASSSISSEDTLSGGAEKKRNSNTATTSTGNNNNTTAAKTVIINEADKQIACKVSFILLCNVCELTPLLTLVYEFVRGYICYYICAGVMLHIQ